MKYSKTDSKLFFDRPHRSHESSEQNQLHSNNFQNFFITFFIQRTGCWRYHFVCFDMVCFAKSYFVKILDKEMTFPKLTIYDSLLMLSMKYYSQN